MRLKERIPLFLEKMDLPKILTILFPTQSTNTIDSFVKEIYPALGRIEKYWYENQDERFTQVLVNMGLIPNIPGVWYYKEDDELLIEQGLEPRDVLFWGKNYTKEMKRLPKTEWILIRDMSTDHIQAVLDGKFTKNPTYLKVFKDELKLREDLTKRK